jgi:ketosteroid isomerase-like protein
VDIGGGTGAVNSWTGWVVCRIITWFGTPNALSVMAAPARRMVRKEERMSAPDLGHIEDWQTDNNDLDRRFLAAVRNKDVDEAMSCFFNSPDLVTVLWGNEFRGPEQLREAIQGMFDRYDEISLSIDRVREFRSGDAVFAVGHATYTFKKAGEESKLTEIWTDVRRKVNGRWVYVLDHAELLPK